MPLSAADVYSPQVPGLATILGSGLGPLRILQQEGYRRAREAAARAKAAADLEKQFTPPAPDTDGGQVFAPQVAENTKALLGFAQEKYQQAVQGQITPNDAKTLVAQKLAETNTTTKRAKDSQAAIDKFKAEARANNLDVGKVGNFVNMATTNPTTGQTMAINEFDPESLLQGVTNADVIDKAGAVQTFLKGLAQKQESDYSKAARLGGTGVTRSSASNIFASDDQGRTIYTLDGQGNRVPKIANLRALEQAALQDPQMAALLRRSLEQGQKPTATALMGIGGEHVTDDQLEALNAQTDQNTGLERQSLADLLRPYGTLVRKEGQTYRAPHFASAGRGKKAPEPYVPPTFDNTEQRYSQPDSQPGMMPVAAQDRPSALPMSGWQQPAVRVDYAVKGTPGATPVDVSTSGKVTNKHIESFVPESFDVIGANGTRERRKNNTQPLSGYPGASHGAYVDEKTGEPLYPKTNAEGDQLVREGKARLQVQFDFNTEKNENFARDLKGTTEQLMTLENEDGNLKYPTKELAEAAARKALTTGTVRTTQMRTPKNAPDVDRLFGPNYRLHQEALDRQTAALRRSAGTAKNPGGSIYKRPATTTTTAAPSRGGSIYKTR